MRKYTPEERIIAFWSRINKNGSIPMHCPELGNCWEWTGAINSSGYGSFRIGSNIIATSRVAYQYAIGEIPHGLFVLHKCDNRKCCKPEHLFLGTNQDNQDDMWAKGRAYHPKGYKLPPRSEETLQRMQVANRMHGKIDSQIASKIRSLYSMGNISQYKLAAKFGISQSQVCHIVKGNQWKD